MLGCSKVNHEGSQDLLARENNKENHHVKNFNNCVVCKDEHGYLVTGKLDYHVYVGESAESLVGVADELNFERHFNVAVELMLSKYTIFHKFSNDGGITLFKDAYGDCVPGGDIMGECLYFCYDELFDTIKSVFRGLGMYLYWSMDDYFAVMEKKQLVELCDYGQVRICKYDGKAGMLRYTEGVEYREG